MQLPRFSTVDDFVVWEERQERKYEFFNGRVSLFPGAVVRHDLIALNMTFALRRVVPIAAVRGSSAKQLTAESSRYPDVSVTLDPRDTIDLTYARYPTLIVEVLSPSTHRVDRGPKLNEYATIATLREYVLVDSRRRWAQTYRRSDADLIASLPITSGTLRFESVGLDLAFDELYAGTEL